MDGFCESDTSIVRRASDCSCPLVEEGRQASVSPAPSSSSVANADTSQIMGMFGGHRLCIRCIYMAELSSTMLLYACRTWCDQMLEGRRR